MTDFKTPITKYLVLRDPFMIASSHWTSGIKTFSKFKQLNPSALTLKTTSMNFGGDGETSISRPREWADIQNIWGDTYGRYVNGLKKIELLDITTSHRISSEAFETFNNTAIGLSVLQNEDYLQISKALHFFNYSFVELNWKYAFRNIEYSKINEELEKTSSDLDKFIVAFKGKQCVVKLSRELLEPYFVEQLKPIFKLLSEKEIPIVLANSKRLILPPSKTSGKENLREYGDGVIIGEYLFLETFNWIKKLKQLKAKGFEIPTIIASGGLTDIKSIIDVFAAGADAVQLCTAFDIHGVHFLEVVRDQLEQVMEDYPSFEEFKTAIQSNDSEWLECASKAEKVISSTESKVFELANLDDQVSNHLKNAISIELGSGSCSSISNLGESKIVKEHRFLINISSIGAYLLSEEIVTQHHFSPIDYAFSKDLTLAFKFDSKQYDFAIIPRSTLNYLHSEPQSVFGQNYPIEIGIVGKSIIDLVGDHRNDLSSIETVFHFGGLSSRYALNSFLKEFQPRIEVIKPKELLPILKYWDSKYAILADYPLSRIYSNFTPTEIERNWDSFWFVEQDLVLISSLGFYQIPNGKEMSEKVLAIVQSLADEISTNQNLFARKLFSKGFITHLCNLFGLDNRTRIFI